METIAIINAGNRIVMMFLFFMKSSLVYLRLLDLTDPENLP